MTPPDDFTIPDFLKRIKEQVMQPAQEEKSPPTLTELTTEFDSVTAEMEKLESRKRELAAQIRKMIGRK